MTRNCLHALLFPTLFAMGAWAQGYQNSDVFFLAGPSLARTQVIGGSNVTLYGSTGFSDAIGYGHQVMRESAVSLWVEFFPIVLTVPAAETATIPGSITLTSEIYVPSARLMVPVASRISVFGALGAGFGEFSNPSLTSDNPPDLKTTEPGHFVVGVGGGVDFRLNRLFSIRVDVRDYITGRNLGGVAGRNHLLPMLGVAFHF